MDRNILSTVLKNRKLFVPLIFTEKQFSVLKKYAEKRILSNAEKKALYTSVTRKIKALDSLTVVQSDTEYYICSPSQMLPSRLGEAKKIIDSYSKRGIRVFVSGSFLFSREFNDIDIYVVRERGYKEKWEGNQHIIFVPDRRLNEPVFQSAALISVSNFMIPTNTKKSRPTLSEIMSTYHEAVIEHMRKEDKPESMRGLISYYNLFCEGRVTNGKELKEKTNIITLSRLDLMMRKLCKELFSETYLYVEIHTYIKTLSESIRNIRPNKHLKRYRDMYEEMIYGRQRSKAEAA